jgi:hypothetical protein
LRNSLASSPARAVATEDDLITGTPMRSVAKFQMFKSGSNQEIVATVLEILEKWIAKKFRFASDGSATIKRSGRDAIVIRSEDSFATSRRTLIELEETVDGGALATRIQILAESRGISVLVLISLGSDAGSISAPTLSLKPPSFIRSIIGTSGWKIDQDHDKMFSVPFRVGLSNVEVFKNLLFSSDRRLPVIAISELDGRALSAGMENRIAKALCGLGHVCLLHDEASWAITKSYGREWSCFNGGVRLYWPFATPQSAPRAHPLWTYDNLLRKSGTEDLAANWLEDELVKGLVNASSFLLEDPTFKLFENEITNKKLSEAAEAAESSDDFRALADLYANDNDKLRQERDIALVELTNLRYLLANMRADSSLRVTAPILDSIVDVEDSIDTISAALQKSIEAHSGFLAFSDNIADQAATLSSNAGPPDKIFRFLSTLQELAIEMERGPIGRSVPVWLKERGVECSVESQSIKNSRSDKKARTWAILGSDTYCEFHLKSKEGTSPDQCPRIYFATFAEKPFVRVGYLGRHF